MAERDMKLGMIITMHSDLEESVKFYKSLGLKLNFHIEQKWAEFILGDVKFGLCPTEQKYDNIRTGIVLEVEEDLLQMHEELKAAGVNFINEPQVAPHGVMVGFKDPCGNVIDFYQATPEKMEEFARNAIKKETQDKLKTEA